MKLKIFILCVLLSLPLTGEASIRFGSAGVFNGLANIGEDSAMQNLTTYTICMWISEFDQGNGNRFWSDLDSTGTDENRIQSANNGSGGGKDIVFVQQQTTTDARAEGIFNFSSGTNYFVCATYNGSGSNRARLWSGTESVALAEVASYGAGTTDGSGTATTDAANENIVGGNQAGNAPCHCDMTWFGQWNSVLSSSEMEAQRLKPHLYNTGTTQLSEFWFGPSGTTTSPNYARPSVNVATFGGTISVQANAALSVIIPDAICPGTYQAASSTYSISCTIATNSNKFLEFNTAILGSAGVTVSSVVWNGGESLTSLSCAVTSGANNIRIEHWGLVAPTAGTHNITVTFSGSANSTSGGLSYYNVNQTTPTENCVTDSHVNTGDSDATVSITPTADYDVIVAVVGTNDTSITAGTSDIIAWNVTGAGGSNLNLVRGPVFPATAKSPTSPAVTTGNTWSMGAIALRDTNASSGGGGGGGGSFDTGFRALKGVGR